MAALSLVPTLEARAGLTDLGSAVAWSGLSGTELDRATPLGALYAALGGVPAGAPQVARIPLDAYDAALAAARVQLPAEGEAAAPAPRPLTPLELSAAAALRGACNIVSGLLFDGTAPGPLQSAAPGPTPLTVAPARKVKLSSVVDVTAEAEIVPLTSSEIGKLFQDYKASRGDYPHPDYEPSPDQLSAVKQLLMSGSAPHTDFAIMWASRETPA